MKASASCKESMQNCMENHSFAFTHLYNDEKAMDMHIHDCYEIYYSISGGKQFLIDNCFYDIRPGDLFLINQYESHYLSQIDREKHERIIVSIDPEYLKQVSTILTAVSISAGPSFPTACTCRRKSRGGSSIISTVSRTTPVPARISWTGLYFWN